MSISVKSNKAIIARGFTLIELLVVIAIIGILSSVVLASLNTARNKGADAAVQGNLSGTRAQAELFYDIGNTYQGVCAATGTSVIGAQVLAAAKAAGLTAVSDDTAGTTSNAVCNDSTTAWAAQVMLKASTGVYCVDSSGKAVTSTTSVLTTTTDYVCS